MEGDEGSQSLGSPSVCPSKKLKLDRDENLQRQAENVNRVFEKLQQLIQKKSDLLKSFTNEYPSFKEKRKQSIKLMLSTIDKLEVYQRNVNITQIVTGSVGLVGGAVTLGGLLLAPVTFGSSLVWTGVGTSLVGGAATIGTSVTHFALIKSAMSECEKATKDDEVLSQLLQEIVTQNNDINSEISTEIGQLERCHKIIEEALGFNKWTIQDTVVSCTLLIRNGKLIHNSVELFREALLAGKLFAKEAPRGVLGQVQQITTKGVDKIMKGFNDLKSFMGFTTKESATVGAKISSIFVAFGMIFDVVQIVLNSTELAGKASSKEANNLKTCILQLEEHEREIDKIKELFDQEIVKLQPYVS